MNSFIGEIKAFPYNFVPVGWLECNGQILNIREYQALFAIIRNIYGGNGKDTFALPNMKGLCMVGQGSVDNGLVNYQLGSRTYGSETVTLSPLNLPSHTHNFIGKGGAVTGRTNTPGTDNKSYLTNITYKRPSDTSPKFATAYLDQPKNSVYLNPETITFSSENSTNSAPHENRSPYLAIRYCICATEGEFPVRP